MQRLGLAGHKSASYSLLAQPVSKALHFVLESANPLSGLQQPQRRIVALLFQANLNALDGDTHFLECFWY